DHCAGSSNTCVDAFQAATVVCRPSAGQCDVAENCTGTSGVCPVDQFASAATSCDDSNGCTQGDHCSGTANMCVNAGYAWSGVLQPINADGSSIFRLGSTIPVKFRLTGACAGISNFIAKVYVAQISNNATGPDVEATSTSAADTGNTFRYDPT